MPVPDRITHAVGLLDPAPDERILEFGGGPGVAAALVCARLVDGTLIALDRSATATARTSARGAAHVAAGRLVTHTAPLHELGAHVAPGSLDAAFGINVNVFWTGPAEREIAALATALRPGGRLLVCYGSGPPGTTRTVTPTIAAALRTRGFVDVAEHSGPAGSAVVAHRAERC